MSKVELIDGVKNLIPADENSLNGYTLVDVRRDEEYTGELGHVEGATLATLGLELEEFLETAPKNAKYLFICRSGMRSTQACLLAESKGFSDVTNLKGGMIYWNEQSLKTEK